MLGTPPAFILSQDQTLSFECLSLSESRWLFRFGFVNCHSVYCLIRIKRIRDSFGQFLTKLSSVSRLVLVPICRFLCSKSSHQCLRHQREHLDEYSLEFSRLFHYSIIKVLFSSAKREKNLTAWCVAVSRGQLAYNITLFSVCQQLFYLFSKLFFMWYFCRPDMLSCYQKLDLGGVSSLIISPCFSSVNLFFWILSKFLSFY